MSYIANRDKNFKTWDYIIGDIFKNKSILVDRWEFLRPIAWKYGDKFRIAFKDWETDSWSKWEPFPSLLFAPKTHEQNSHLAPAIDVHRSILENEIIAESDYPTYEENHEAARILGAILEKKGFSPMYYYSGNKSIHIHIFLDNRMFERVNSETEAGIDKFFNGSVDRFRSDFMTWIRAKIISCWDTNTRKFDRDMIRASHLIRCELSKNKLGYKTFLGYSWKDVSFIPSICNEDNGFYPRIGKVVLSMPYNIHEMFDEFLAETEAKIVKRRAERSNTSLSTWMPEKREQLRECVKTMMVDDFKKVGDGKNRAMFIIVNELKRLFGEDQARIIINDWNERMGNAIQRSDIEYRIRMKDYNLSCEYIHSLLGELNIDVSQKCKGKVYK
jgi:hypothetical protein